MKGFDNLSLGKGGSAVRLKEGTDDLLRSLTSLYLKIVMKTEILCLQYNTVQHNDSPAKSSHLK